MSRSAFRLLPAILIFMASCGGDTPTDPVTLVPTTLTLSGADFTLTSLGATAQRTASVFDQNGDPMANATVVWTSSSAGVVTVSSAGRVTAVANGTAQVTAAAGVASASVVATVAQVVDSVSVTMTDLAFDEVGDTTTIVWSALDAGGSVVPGAAATWAISDSSVVSLSPDGLLTVLSEGDAVVTLTAAGVSAQINVVITIAPLVPAKILFTTSRAGAWEVYAMDEDGGNPVNLTNDPADDLHGKARPDGAKIAFTSNRDGDREIYVMDPDGTNPVNLTNDSSDDWFPDWSPDGMRIAFTRDDTLHVMDADGGNVTSLQLRGLYASWSPDGTRIAYILGTQLWVADADGSNPVNLNRFDWQDAGPDWSPDGSRITFSSRQGASGGHDIWEVDPDGGNPDRLTTVPGFGEGWPAWHPDGSKVLYSANQTGDAEIWMMDADGSSQTQLSFDAGFDSYPSWIRIPPP